MDIKDKDSNSILKGLIIEALGTVYDPEIPVSIWELGLVYNIDIDDKFNVLITMTLTTPNCPEAETIPDRVAEAVSKWKMLKMLGWKLCGSQLGLKTI